MKAQLKTIKSDNSVTQFLDNVPSRDRRQDSYVLLELMKRISREEPKMWGSSIVGFGSYHYKYESGREGDWFLTGFSPRKGSLSIYIMSGSAKFSDIVKRLGRHKAGKGCLYVKRLTDIDLAVLSELITASIRDLKKRSKA